MTFIIAEISGNHNGDLAKAKELICAAERSGCDAVKFQLYTPEDLGDQYDPKTNFPVPVDWVPVLFETAYRAGIPLFASIFHPTAVGVLRSFSPFAYKIASPESTRLPDQIYKQISDAVHNEYAKLFVSTGRAQFDWAQSLRPDLMFYCKHGYPAKIDDSDLDLMETMLSGFSDHTAGMTATLAMIQAGATHIEKHFMLELGCPDDMFSLNPDQMKKLCRRSSRWR